jgi:V8-like Glu-specific endopeptidase
MSKFLFIFAAIFFAQAGYALPLPKGPRALVQIPSTFTTDYNFEGIVQLSNCSGALIRFENSKDTDSAMVMTNGHCLESGMPHDGTFVYHQANHRGFNLFNSSAQTAARLMATSIIYSTMTKTDITIYQVNDTYASILTRSGVHPLTLSSKHPGVNTPIEIISGYWSRGYTCSINGFVYNLKEEEYTWEDSLRYSSPGCEVIGGTSGSPILEKGTRNVIAINNTGNEDGQRCTENNPCEIDQNGNVVVKQGTNYGEETYQIYSCLNANNQIDLTVPGCQLFH